MTRLIDLHCDWLLQYAPETTVFEPALYPTVKRRLPQSDGYLQATRASVLSCYRKSEEWATRTDPWQALGELITRIEAEFSGRLLMDPEDLVRWRDDPQGLAWGMIGVEGFDSLVQSAADLDRLEDLVRRGVRLFQPVYSSTSGLGGSSARGDTKGLTPLGLGFLERLEVLSKGAKQPKLLLDLAHFNQESTAEVLDWYEANPSRADFLIPIYSHGTLAHPDYQASRAISRDNLVRLRSLGGMIGLSVSPPFHLSPDQLYRAIESVAAIPFRGLAGYEGIGIGTDFLGVDQVLPTLANAPEVIAWVQARFPGKIAGQLLCKNAEFLFERLFSRVNLAPK